MVVAQKGVVEASFAYLARVERGMRLFALILFAEPRALRAVEQCKVDT